MSFLRCVPIALLTLPLDRFAIIKVHAETSIRDLGATSEDSSLSSTSGSESPGDDAAAVEHLNHLLPDNVQHVLGDLLTKHGHPEAGLDGEASALMHLLLPESDTGDESSASFDSELSNLLSDVAEESAKAKAEEEAAAAARAAEAEERRQKRQEEEDAARQEREAAKAAEHAKYEEERLRRAEAFQATRKAHEEFMQKSRDRTAAAHKKHEEMMSRHANMGQHVEELLRKVHSELEADTHGFRDVPFWDDFFQNTSTRSHWGQLSFELLRPALRHGSWLPEHRVLVLEPSSALGLAERLAGSLREAAPVSVLAHTYGAEPDGEFDLVLELGLLDAVAMGGNNAGTSRIPELRRAFNRFQGLLRPGGAWVSVSAVPPALRLPLLQRLSSGAFLVPDAVSEETAVDESQPSMHTISLQAEAPIGGNAARLRGAATVTAADNEAQRVANLLLYGQKDPHVFAYRLHRSPNSAADAADADNAAELEGLVAAQRPEDAQDEL